MAASEGRRRAPPAMAGAKAQSDDEADAPSPGERLQRLLEDRARLVRHLLAADVIAERRGGEHHGGSDAPRVFQHVAIPERRGRRG